VGAPGRRRGLLLIAAANVANLLLVRSHHRTRELVLRRALGAEGRRVASQLITESTVLATLGGLAGVALAAWGLTALGPMIPSGVLPGYAEPRVSFAAFSYSLIVLAVVGVATGLVPALASARDDLASRLREDARSASGGTRRLRAQHVFVVAQISLALVLMVGAGLLTRSFRAQLAVDPGAELDGVLAMRVQLPRARYGDDDVVWRFASELERGLLSVPGVRSASISSDLPFRGGSSASYIYKEGTGPEDRIR
jgi:putative ABC transport system permease protein